MKHSSSLLQLNKTNKAHFYLLSLYFVVRDFLYRLLKFFLRVDPGMFLVEGPVFYKYYNSLDVMKIEDLWRRFLLVENILQLILGSLLFLAH